MSPHEACRYHERAVYPSRTARSRDASADGRHDRDRARRRDTKSGAVVHATRVYATANGASDPWRDGRRMSDGAANMNTAKRRINTDKHERDRAVIVQIKDQGREDQLKATVVARRAGVHRSFVSNHFAGQLAHAKADIQSRFIAGLSGQTALSAASLRVEMDTAKHNAREAQQEIRDLKARLARTLGEKVAAKQPEHSVPVGIVKDLLAQVDQLLLAQSDLHRRLRDSEEELEAARRLNRTLIRERNSNATELGQ
jgi:hypothetical protein